MYGWFYVEFDFGLQIFRTILTLNGWPLSTPVAQTSFSLHSGIQGMAIIPTAHIHICSNYTKFYYWHVYIQHSSIQLKMIRVDLYDWCTFSLCSRTTYIVLCVVHSYIKHHSKKALLDSLEITVKTGKAKEQHIVLYIKPEMCQKIFGDMQLTRYLFNSW